MENLLRGHFPQNAVRFDLFTTIGMTGNSKSNEFRLPIQGGHDVFQQNFIKKCDLDEFNLLKS